MNIFARILNRPVGASLLGIGLTIAGLCAYWLLGVAALPSLNFPGVAVFAQMPGASARTMATTIVAPLERQLGRIPGVTEMTSDTTDGGTQIQLLFDYDKNADKAAIDVQAAIEAALKDLPADMPSPPQFYKYDTSQIPILLVALTSSSLPPARLYDLTNNFLQPAVAQIPGVAQVQVFGGSPHAIRIALNIGALAQIGLDTNDVANALAAANVRSPQGMLSNGITQMTVVANDALQTPQEFASLVIATRHGVPVRLSDVATVTSGQEDEYQAGWFNGRRAVVMQITKRVDANSITVVRAIRKTLPKLGYLLPADVEMTPIFDLTGSTKSAIREVEVALLTSIAMVALVMLVFFRQMRPALIAIFSVPLAISGAFVLMWFLGFTLNTLSLIALVLCIGFVVDDAIVVIDNIVRHIELGRTAPEAALRGTREIGFTILSITLSLVAMFAPLLFGNNILVMLMREFSLTLIATIVISAVVSLTLTPALCGRYLLDRPRDSHPRSRLLQRLDGFDHLLLDAYKRLLDWAMGHRRLLRWQSPLLLVVSCLLALAVIETAGGGLMPQEDTGMLQVQIVADANISPTLLASRTQAVVAAIMSDPAVADITSVLGSNSNNGAVGNQASLFVDLKPRGRRAGEREISLQQVIARLSDACKRFRGLKIHMTAMQFIDSGSNGAGGQYSFDLVSNDGSSLQMPTLRLAKVMRKMQQFQDVSTSYDVIGKQQRLIVDRHAASRLNVGMGQIDSVLYSAFGQNQVSVIYTDISQHHVVLTAADAQAASPDAMLDVYVRNAESKMIRMSSLAHVEPRISPTDIQHYNQVESASINYNLSPGITEAAGLKMIDKAIFMAHLPQGIQKRYTGTNLKLMQTIQNALIALVTVVLAMYIVLGILYESLVHPLTILSTLPAAGMGAFLAMLITHTQLTAMSVIAVLMLIGIVKKNAILMVDFALVEEREHGATPVEAIRRAALTRFRPIMMTTVVSMAAALPLAIGFGMGAETRQPLGIAIVGGLVASQLLTLLSTPAMYLWLYDRRERKARRKLRKVQACALPEPGLS